ncbi:hypothetical protein [Salinibacter ruber]|uniref:hypothetical protein n=1 Tax=Salinibacter ruber TaxID=146919 RepID=UPI00216778E7|nr:hypothetical protein [Salinibacter ruber]MCS4173837.1 putative membrane protein YgcG [Salinibacter ruber]
MGYTCDNGESASDPEGSGDEGDDPSHINSEFPSGSSGSREPCTCGFSDGVEVEYSEVDAHSGEVEDRSFKKASQKERCPRCGGYNLDWRQRFIAHCASVGKRLGRKHRVFFVSFVLIRSAADEVGLGTEESYEVLKNLWDRARRGMKRRAEEVDYSGVLATRPSDNRYHGHVLVYASLTRYELMRAFHVRGLDTYIEPFDNTAATNGNDGRSPDDEGNSGGNDRGDWDARARFGMPKDEGMGAESFAAKKGAYIWENAAASKNSRYTSSRGNGAGYNSKEARRRRREAVNGQSDGNGDGTSDRDGEPSSSDPSPSLNSNGRGSGGGGGQDPGGSEGRNRGPNCGNRRSRAPPVDCGGGRFPNLDAALAAAKAAFTRRVGTTVSVVDQGSAELLKVYRDGDRLMCVVVMGGQSTTTKVPWGQVGVINSPTIRSGSGGTSGRNGDGNDDEGRSDSDGGGENSDSGSSNESTPSDPGEGGSGGDGDDPDGDSADTDGPDPDDQGGPDGGGPDDNDSDGDDPDGDDGRGENGSSDDDEDNSEGNDDESKDDGSTSDAPSERFEQAADKSVVQTKLPSQDRLKTVFDYETGKARASVLSPRHSTSD